MHATTNQAPETAVPMRGPLTDSVFKRVFWLYGLYSLIYNACFLVGYYYLPDGWLRGSPSAAVGTAVAAAETFWGEFALTLLVNMGFMVGLAVALNVSQVKGLPAGYVLPISLAVVSGLILGTNSFTASDVDQFSTRDGLALGLSIGGLEMLGYILVIAATVKLGVYQYRSWWRWRGEWQPTKTMDLRAVRLSRAETLCLLAGLALLVVAAYRETVMALGG